MIIRIRNKKTGEILKNNSWLLDDLFISATLPHSILSVTSDDNDDGDLVDFVTSKNDEYEVVEGEG